MLLKVKIVINAGTRKAVGDNAEKCVSFNKWLVCNSSGKNTNNDLDELGSQCPDNSQPRTAQKAERKVLSRQILVKFVTPAQSRAWLEANVEIIVCKGD